MVTGEEVQDPLIFSVGWRRFQSVPLFSLKHVVAGEDRNRLIKYTPEHMHCLAQMYAPLTAPNTGNAHQYKSPCFTCQKYASCCARECDK